MSHIDINIDQARLICNPYLVPPTSEIFNPSPPTTTKRLLTVITLPTTPSTSSEWAASMARTTAQSAPKWWTLEARMPAKIKSS